MRVTLTECVERFTVRRESSIHIKCLAEELEVVFDLYRALLMQYTSIPLDVIMSIVVRHQRCQYSLETMKSEGKCQRDRTVLTFHPKTNPDWASGERYHTIPSLFQKYHTGIYKITTCGYSTCAPVIAQLARRSTTVDGPQRTISA